MGDALTVLFRAFFRKIALNSLGSEHPQNSADHLPRAEQSYHNRERKEANGQDMHEHEYAE